MRLISSTMVRGSLVLLLAGCVVDVDGDGSPYGEDCDDADADAYPGAEEVWYDGVDQDCDGGDDFDADGDGYADMAYDGDDCDDADSDVHPDAAEICDDGVDNDCDGTSGGCALSGELSLADADAKLIGEESYDLVGRGGALMDMTGDGIDDIAVGAYGAPAGAYSGRVYLLTSPVAGTVDLAEAEAVLTGSDEEQAQTVTALPDDGVDTYVDLAIGAPERDDGGDEVGAAYVWYSPISGALDLRDGDATIAVSNGQVGTTLSGGGDLNGDGISDLVVGAPYEYEDYAFYGAAYVFFGPVTGDLGPSDYDAWLPEDSGHLSVVSIYYWGGLSRGLSADGDVNGDGVSDLLIGAPWGTNAWDRYSTDAGTAYLYLGPVTGDISTEDAVLAAMGSAACERVGISVEIAGDLDGDGLDDLIVGSSGYASGLDQGFALFVLGTTTGAEAATDLSFATWEGEAGGDNFGRGVTSAGDLDGDGWSDVAVQAQCDTTCGERDTGAVYIVYGPLSPGTFSASDADAVLIGEAKQDNAGTYLLTSGDANADGLSDLLIGAVGNDDGGTFAGAAYLVLGSGL